MSTFRYICELCNYHTNTSQSFYQHKKTQKHYKNVEEYKKKKRGKIIKRKDGKFYCECCIFYPKTRQSYYSHLKSKKHKINYDKFVNLRICDKNLRNYDKNLRNCVKKTPYNQTKYISKNKKEFICEKCNNAFKHSYSLTRHIKNNRCIAIRRELDTKIEKKQKIINNTSNITTNNITNNTTNNNDNRVTNNNNVINIVFNINSVEEAEKIKSILTSAKIEEICKPERSGLPLQSYDIVRKIQRLSIESKKNNKELQNFRKTNCRNDLINVFIDNQFKVVDFKQYNRDDLLKFAENIIDCCDDGLAKGKSYEDKLDLICDVLKEYDYYKNLDEELQDGTTQYIITAIDECERQSRMAHYNITRNEPVEE